MTENLTSEDILVLVVMISIVYGVINLVQKKTMEYFERKKALDKWGLGLPLNDNQQRFLLKLWMAYRNKYVPDTKLIDIVSKEELEEIKKYCSTSILPDNLKTLASEKTKFKAVKKFMAKGYNEELAFILSGLIYNKIGGISAIKKISSSIL